MIHRQPSFETRLVRAGWEPHLEDGYINPPIYRSSTVLYEDVATMEQSQADPL